VRRFGIACVPREEQMLVTDRSVIRRVLVLSVVWLLATPLATTLRIHLLQGVGGTTPDVKGLADRMTVDAGILASTRALIVPGTSLILTDAPVNGDTHGTSDFRILTTSAEK